MVQASTLYLYLHVYLTQNRVQAMRRKTEKIPQVQIRKPAET